MAEPHTPLPWEHEGMRIEGGRLLVAGRDAEALAREHGTPLYVFDLRRIGEQASRPTAASSPEAPGPASGGAARPRK